MLCFVVSFVWNGPFFFVVVLLFFWFGGFFCCEFFSALCPVVFAKPQAHTFSQKNCAGFAPCDNGTKLFETRKCASIGAGPVVLASK